MASESRYEGSALGLPVQAAASDQDGVMTFFIANDSSRSSLTARAGTQEKVRAIRLGSLNAARPIRFIKIDVEGAERHALRGAERIRRADPPIIQFESMPRAAPSYCCEPHSLRQLLVAECVYEIYQGPDLAPVSALSEEVVANLYAIHPEGMQPR